MTALLKTDYAALAAEVTTALTAIVEGLGDLEARTKAITDTAWQDYLAATNKGNLYPAMALNADWDLADDLKRVVEDISHKARNWQETVASSTSRRAERLSQNEAEQKTLANIEAAKTADPIDSGFSLLSAHIVLLKGKPSNKATVLYTANGVIYEASVDRHPTTGELSLETSYRDDFERVQVRGGSDNDTQRLFWADMTAEDIGKAAHLRKQIMWAAWEQFDNLPKKRR